MIEKKFKLFQCCIITKGISNSIIIDFQRKQIYTFKTELIEIFERYQGRSIYDLFYDFHESKNELKAYIRYFLTNELIILADDLSLFPDVERKHKSSSLFESVTLDINLDLWLKLKSELKFFDMMGVKSFKIIIRSKIEFNELNEIIGQLNNLRAIQITLFISHDCNLTKSNLLQIKAHIKVHQIIIYGKQIRKFRIEEVFYDSDDISNILFRGVSTVQQMVLDFRFYFESCKSIAIQNKTIFLSNDGEIFTDFSKNKRLGNVNNMQYVHSELEKNTNCNISRDKILICKDCEYRYICPDQNLIILNKSTLNHYEKTQICGYNPYTNNWI